MWQRRSWNTRDGGRFDQMGSSVLRKLKPYYIRKALRYLRHYGPKDFMIRVRERLAPEEVPYGPWFEKHRASEAELDEQRASFKAREKEQDASPLFSVVVPAFRTPERYLREMLRCVLDQTYPDLELVIANASPDDEKMAAILAEAAERDARVKVLPLAENAGIAGNTNAAIEAASGEYICFLDHDDLIAPDALYEAARCAEAGAELIYTDEDKVRDDGMGGLEHFQPHFKPDFSLDLLRSNNYICHFLMVKRSLIGNVGGIRAEFEGAQDYEFILRCVDRILAGDSSGRPDPAGSGKSGSGRIAHIPKVLYHWRVHEASTADNPDSKRYAYEAGKRALEEHLLRWGIQGEVSQTKDHGFYRVKYPLTDHPKVSIIIPNREMRPMLERCLNAVRENTEYDNYEVLVVENNSSSGEILDYYKRIQGKGGVRVIRWKGEKNGEDKPRFSFSAVNNFGVRHASGEYLVFLNNDVEVRKGWLGEMLSVCLRPEVGAAGAKLFYPDGKVQSAGIVVGIGGTAGSLFAGMNGDFSGYLHRASLMQDLSAVTAAMMMVRRSAFEEAGGFDEDLPVAMNDVDLCLKLRKAGLLIVFDPYAQAVHHESLSRGDEYTAEKAQRYRAEIALVKERWADLYETGDPYYNPNLSLARWDYSLEP